MKRRPTARRLVRLALLTALALILFVVEAQIPLPIPLPGVKLGLSNVVTVAVLFLDGPLAALAVLVLRIGLGAVVTGQVSAIVYSLAGGLCSLLCMLLLRRVLERKKIWVASVIGGLAHNAGQIAAAIALTRTPSLILYLPILAALGMAAGLFTGLAATFVTSKLQQIGHSSEENRHG